MLWVMAGSGLRRHGSSGGALADRIGGLRHGAGRIGLQAIAHSQGLSRRPGRKGAGLFAISGALGSASPGIIPAYSIAMRGPVPSPKPSGAWPLDPVHGHERHGGGQLAGPALIYDHFGTTCRVRHRRGVNGGNLMIVGSLCSGASPSHRGFRGSIRRPSLRDDHGTPREKSVAVEGVGRGRVDVGRRRWRRRAGNGNAGDEHPCRNPGIAARPRDLDIEAAGAVLRRWDRRRKRR